MQDIFVESTLHLKHNVGVIVWTIRIIVGVIVGTIWIKHHNVHKNSISQDNVIRKGKKKYIYG